jgi:hypothetical protein
VPGRSRAKKQNTLLQWHRAQRGWSRAELARQVNHSINTENDQENVPLAAVDEETVKSWEIRHGTHKAFAKHLCLVFQLSASELGLLSDAELALRPDSRQPTLPPSGIVELRRLTSARREGTTKMAEDPRSRWAPALRAAGVPFDLDQEAALVGHRTRRSASSRPDLKAVKSYAEIVGHQRSLYWTSTPDALLDAASAHLALGATMLSNDPEDNAELASAVAECALLVARLAFFDLDCPRTMASDAFKSAERGVIRAQDHSLAVAVAAHQAFVPGFDRNLPDARPFIVAAERQWRRSSRNPLVRSWLHCVTAEIYARSMEIKESRYHIRQAQEYLSKSDGTAPLWLDFYDSSRFAGFAGNTALLSGSYKEAAGWLEKSLDDLNTDSSKQRSVLLLDLAAAHAADEPEHALELAIEACDHLEQDYYQMAVNRIPNVRAALSGSRSAARLTERAERLLALGPAECGS